MLDTYKEVLEHKKTGRLPDIQLIFPNVELRLDTAPKDSFVNIHLLISPEDPNHIEELERILKRLQFKAFDDTFDCTESELIRLGEKHASHKITDQRTLLKEGATQFKVNLDNLQEVYRDSEWAKKNILIAVAGGQKDGTSGLRMPADATIRQKIEKFAHIIFSSQARDREFWLGRDKITPNQLKERYGGCKPCLHGCDAHDQEKVAKPAKNRFCWIKGDLEFDALRHTCIVPDGRAFVGVEPPTSAIPSQVISNVSIANAPWVKTPEISLNSGLVAIIGARGSGKTALADIIAAGCNSMPKNTWSSNGNISPSFLNRASDHLGDAKITLLWGSEEKSTKKLNKTEANNHDSYPRARYLSQQFVEKLCSGTNTSDELVEEIERVIFESHSVDERDGATSFPELRERRTNRFKQARIRENGAISALSDRIAIEVEKRGLKDELTHQVAQKQTRINNYNSDLKKLVVKGTETEAKRLAELRKAARLIRGNIQPVKDQRQTFLAMRDEVRSTRETTVPELLRRTKDRHNLSGLNDQQWEDFRLIYQGDVDKTLNEYIKGADQQIATLIGNPIQQGDLNTPHIADNIDPKGRNLSTIKAEILRLENLLSVEHKYITLANRIEQENSALKALKDKLADAEGADDRRKQLQTERNEAYQRLFEAITQEQKALEKLYAPLMQKLSNRSDTLGRLAFSVQRTVDVKKWGAFAEENLIDCRKAGPFNGRESLTSIAEDMLKPAWQSGSATTIKEAMAKFVEKHSKDFLKHERDKTDRKAWLKDFAQWLYGTDHISIQYTISYGKTDIRNLSPGTRGVVLLLLYLALDENDDRPLIIDQPEENLDPKSVHDELVPLFIEAKAKRQVIMVTHNANLVVNTDADQIIIAEAGPNKANGLPPITYQSGGLENAQIRTSVCNILEGGESAFQERARRLRVRLER